MKNKKTLYIIIAVFILFASCKNSFEGTELNINVLKETVADERTDNKGFIIKTIGSCLNTDNQVISLEAYNNYDEDEKITNVDWDTLYDAMTIYKLKDASDENSVYERDGEINFTIQSVRENRVSVLIDLRSVETNLLEVFVNPTILTAANGLRKLNSDEDRYQGEEGDDDFVGYITVAAYVDPDDGSVANPISPLSTGIKRCTRPKFIIDENNIVYKYSTNNSLINGIIVIFGRYFYDDNDDPIGTIPYTTNYKSLFDNTVVVERYVLSSNKWETISGNSSYDETTGLYEVNFTEQPDGTAVRVRLENIQNLKTKEPIAGYVAKYSYNNDINTEVLDSEVSFLFPDSSYFLVELSDFFYVTTHFDSKGYNGSIVLDFQNSLGTFGSEGLDLSTIKAENFKIIRDDGVNVEVVEANYEYDQGQSIPTKIVLKLAKNYKKSGQSFRVFVSPEVKTHEGKSLGAPWQFEFKYIGFNIINSYVSGVRDEEI